MEMENDAKVGELLQSRQDVGPKSLVYPDDRLNFTPVVVGEIGTPANDHADRLEFDPTQRTLPVAATHAETA